MTRFWTSDLHFGHANIIRYCNRPFADVDEMNLGLIARWNAVVEPDDSVWVLGDVAMGKIDDSLALISALNGTKTLVAGNHDRCWEPGGPRHGQWTERYLDAGFADVLQGTVDVELGGRAAIACHFPYEGDSHDDDRFVPMRPRDTGLILLHGHVHERWRVNGRQINVGVDVWEYTPVTDEQILAALAAGA